MYIKKKYNYKKKKKNNIDRNNILNKERVKKKTLLS
jgi:hypothetical protein